MGLYRDTGVVLRTFRLGEADRIVSLLTRDHGLVRAVVKGVRKTKSRFGARLDQFAHVDMQLWEGRGELRTVSQADLVAGHAAIRHDYDAYATAQTMCEATEHVAVEGLVNEQLRRMLLAGLATLDSRVSRGLAVPASLRPAFLLKLLGVTGFGPGLSSCVSCGGREGLSAFTFEDGGVVCGTCARPGDPRLDPGDVDVLGLLWTTRFDDMGELPTFGVDGLIQKAVEYHLERRLKTLCWRPPSTVMRSVHATG
ncbi:MAG: DNA repair protein RecO [Actinobacteria bacterium ATB1]|nr:DNA repair protein RecO [Actinobacteria bacterium ATB1]